MFLAFAAVAFSPRADIPSAAAAGWARAISRCCSALVLGGLGAILIVRSVVLDGEPLPRSTSCRWRSSRSRSCLFGLAIEPLGLVVSLAILIVLAAFAGPQFAAGRSRGAGVGADRVFGRHVRLRAAACRSPSGRASEAPRWTCFPISRSDLRVALDAPEHRSTASLGVLLGTIIGVLPGIGPVTTVAMLLPISFTLSPNSALIMLAGIYYGAQYGGSTTAILVNIPGEASSVVTTHRRPPDGAAGPRRAGARHCGARLVLRRHASRRC